jgi:hypothetical protein
MVRFAVDGLWAVDVFVDDMPRKRRVEYAGAMYHVMSRGNRQGGYELLIWALLMNDLNKVLDMAGLICFARRDARPANQVVGPGGSHGIGSNRCAVD